MRATGDSSDPPRRLVPCAQRALACARVGTSPACRRSGLAVETCGGAAASIRAATRSSSAFKLLPLLPSGRFGAAGAAAWVAYPESDYKFALRRALAAMAGCIWVPRHARSWHGVRIVGALGARHPRSRRKGESFSRPSRSRLFSIAQACDLFSGSCPACGLAGSGRRATLGDAKWTTITLPSPAMAAACVRLFRMLSASIHRRYSAFRSQVPIAQPFLVFSTLTLWVCGARWTSVSRPSPG